MMTRDQIDFSYFRRMFPHNQRMIECYELMSHHRTVLYGEELIGLNEHAVIHVVANPLSAVLYAIDFIIPDWHGVWVATEQAVLTDDHFAALAGRCVMFHPTGRQCLQWQQMETRWRPLLDSSWVDDTFALLQPFWPAAADADPAYVYTLNRQQRYAFFNGWLGDPIPFLQSVGAL